jgi:hypothetical protein
VGNTVLRLGAAVFAFGVLTAVTSLPEYAVSLFGVVILAAVVRMLYRLNTSTPDAAEA